MLRTFDQEQDQHQQRGEAQCRAQLERVLQWQLGGVLGLLGRAQVVKQGAGGIGQPGRQQRGQ